jgi:nitrilase/aliphatic nitrilase
LTEAIRLRSAAHAFEGKVFNIVASCALDADAVEQLSQGDSKMKELLRATPGPVSMIVGPDGEALADPVAGGEGMVVADIDIAQSIELKMMHDIVGHYNRFDIFHLEVDPTPNQPVWIKKLARTDDQPTDESPVSQDEAAGSANDRPIAVVRAKAQ